MSHKIEPGDFICFIRREGLIYYQIKYITSEGYMKLSLPNKSDIMMVVSNTPEGLEIPGETKEKGFLLYRNFNFVNKQQYNEIQEKLKYYLSLPSEELLQLLLKLDRKGIDYIFKEYDQIRDLYFNRDFWKQKFQRDYGFIGEKINEKKFDWEKEHFLRNLRYELFTNYFLELKKYELLDVSRLEKMILGFKVISIYTRNVCNLPYRDERFISNNIKSYELALKLFNHEFNFFKLESLKLESLK